MSAVVKKTATRSSRKCEPNGLRIARLSIKANKLGVTHAEFRGSGAFFTVLLADAARQ